MSIAHRAIVALTFLLVGAGLSLAFSHHTHRPPTTASTPDQVPPPGWHEVCDSVTIGFVCHTYPPGDRSWEPTAPLPPHLPLRLPNPSRADDAR